MNALLSLPERNEPAAWQKDTGMCIHIYTYQKSTSSCFFCVVQANFPQAEKHAMASATCLFQEQGGTATTLNYLLPSRHTAAMTPVS